MNCAGNCLHRPYLTSGLWQMRSCYISFFICYLCRREDGREIKTAVIGFQWCTYHREYTVSELVLVFLNCFSLTLIFLFSWTVPVFLSVPLISHKHHYCIYHFIVFVSWKFHLCRYFRNSLWYLVLLAIHDAFQ